ncbi:MULTISPECIES: S8 family peptidase [unclassified Novosphingobium]|uniref:S8 family peptidase n=1 Tax=unclassified Novosphingobium TaxID=2644732 RepID=UPI00146CC9F5|nr:MULTISPECIES: S8 family peptidase [unclassified Novosphingobium]NMN06417.1 subtilisin family serine protease [Novosphingobium sp. SG919]NMN89138.1 subtilisin family serine protease [Novosphingobium sp. SG916]
MAEIVQSNVLSEQLRKSQLAGDLLEAIEARRADNVSDANRMFNPDGPIKVIIEANARTPGGVNFARLAIAHELFVLVHSDVERTPPEAFRLRNPFTLPPGARIDGHAYLADGDTVDFVNSFWTDQYLFACLSEKAIAALSTLRIVVGDKTYPLVHKIWLNHAVGRFVFESGRTVKCDAARAAFSAAGNGIVWAVADTGIDGSHFHFQQHETLQLPDGLQHMDFTGAGSPLVDTDGHGTHVAAIIAGETIKRPAGSTEPTQPAQIVVQQKVRTSDTQIDDVSDLSRTVISGVAPECKLVSLKVLQDGQTGDVATLLAAIGYLQSANNDGRNLRIHGLNLSLGYTFDARWFAAGQSPLCVEVDRLVRSGVVVVVAAGNGGYGTVQSLSLTTERASHLATISDPGNADLAITVGSTHRDSPHTYGISYFSSKGPTADGRMKPDLVAPGERIVSAMVSDPAQPDVALFHEDTGTSMAAPHVSGAIAAFLSVRREFKGRPDAVKQIFIDSATDLKRRPEFQGAGLIDVMRALQSV